MFVKRSLMVLIIFTLFFSSFIYKSEAQFEERSFSDFYPLSTWDFPPFATDTQTYVYISLIDKTLVKTEPECIAKGHEFRVRRILFVLSEYLENIEGFKSIDAKTLLELQLLAPDSTHGCKKWDDWKYVFVALETIKNFPDESTTLCEELGINYEEALKLSKQIYRAFKPILEETDEKIVSILKENMN